MSGAKTSPALELRRRGYEILARRYRTRRGEIDIVARHGSTLVFVEVKARAGQEFGGGAAAVTGASSVGSRGWRWSSSRGTARPTACRFDVVVVTPGPVPRVEVYTHAFAGS